MPKSQLHETWKYHREEHEGHEGRKDSFKIRCPLYYPIFVFFANTLENRNGGGLRSVLVRLLDSVIPAWSAGIQADMDVSGCILHTWMPAIHAGKTKLSIFMFCGRA